MVGVGAGVVNLGGSLRLGRLLVIQGDRPCGLATNGIQGTTLRRDNLLRLAVGDLVDDDLLALHLLGGGLAADLRPSFSQCLRLRALGELGIGPFAPHGVGALGLAALGGVVFLPALQGVEGDSLPIHHLVDGVLAPLRVGDLDLGTLVVRVLELLGHIRPEHRLVGASIVA
ncbi:hypothetical protein D3C80_598680 [compost metagenome]